MVPEAADSARSLGAVETAHVDRPVLGDDHVDIVTGRRDRPLEGVDQSRRAPVRRRQRDLVGVDDTAYRDPPYFHGQAGPH